TILSFRWYCCESWLVWNLETFEFKRTKTNQELKTIGVLGAAGLVLRVRLFLLTLLLMRGVGGPVARTRMRIQVGGCGLGTSVDWPRCCRVVRAYSAAGRV